MATFVQALLAAVGALLPQAPVPSPSALTLTPKEKAALVVVSGLPAPPGVGGVLIQDWSRDLPRPRGALVFADQEGTGAKAFAALPPFAAASDYVTREEAFRAGRATAHALRDQGVDVDLAPVLDAPTGPLGSRHFRRGVLGVAFARGLAAGGAAACAKHFPGLGAARVSTDERPRVHARLRAADLAAFRAAVRAGVPCMMLSHALYPGFRNERAIVSPTAYRLLRRTGFRGVAITDSLSVVRGPWPRLWARQAVHAGADLILYTSAADAREAIHALVPVARAGALDRHVARVVRFRAAYGLPTP